MGLSRCKDKNNKQKCEDFHPRLSHQVVELRVLAEEGFSLLLLTADKVLDVHIEAGRGDAVGAQRRLLTLLKQQGQEREQGMSAEGAQKTEQLLNCTFISQNIILHFITSNIVWI